MNYLRQLIPVALAFSGFIFVQCKKDNLSKEEKTSTQIQYIQKNSVEKQQFTINTNQNEIIKGIQGTILLFPTSPFETESGLPVSGNVTISLQEIYKKKDMLLANRHTQTKDDYLISGGEFNIEAFSGTTKLRLKEGKSIRVIPIIEGDLPVEGMKVFIEGNEDDFVWEEDTTSDAVIVTESLFTTIINDDILAIDTVDNDSIEFDLENWIRDSYITDRLYYYMEINSIGWINCDAFYGFEQRTSVIIRIPISFEITNTLIKIFINDFNSMISPDKINETDEFREYHFTYAGGIPINSAIKAIAISGLNDKDYAVLQDETVLENMIITLTPVEVTEEEIGTMFDSL